MSNHFVIVPLIRLFYIIIAIITALVEEFSYILDSQQLLVLIQPYTYSQSFQSRHIGKNLWINRLDTIV